MPTRGTLHHLEIWVADIEAARGTIGWLLEQLGYDAVRSWAYGSSWQLGDTYLVVEAGPDVAAERHERLRPGLNHLAFHAGSPSEVEALASEAQLHGWTLLFGDRHPYAGGPGRYAAYLESEDGFEVELVASAAS